MELWSTSEEERNPERRADRRGSASLFESSGRGESKGAEVQEAKILLTRGATCHQSVDSPTSTFRRRALLRFLRSPSLACLVSLRAVVRLCSTFAKLGEHCFHPRSFLYRTSVASHNREGAALVACKLLLLTR